MAGFNVKKLFNNLTNKKRYSGYISGGLPIKASSWNGGDFLRAYDISLYVNRAISKRSEKVGEIEFIAKDPKTDDIIENYEGLDILNKPNKLFSGPKFWGLAQKYYDLTGEVYIWLEGQKEFMGKNRKVNAMHLLMPAYMKTEFNSDGSPAAFKYKTPTGKEIAYSPEEIIFIHNPNPSHPLKGQSLLTAGINAIQTEIQISTYHSRVLENGGKVEGVFKFKTDRLTREQLTDIKDKYKKEYSDARKSGLPLFVGGDTDYLRTGLTPDELAFLEAKKMTLEDICILTGVPKSMLASTADVKFDNADADRSIFLRETINPLLKMFVSSVGEKLFGKDIKLAYVDPTPENAEQKLKETESGVKNYYMTINEARKRHGLDPIDNGDTIMVPFSVIPMGQERSIDTDTDEKGKKKGIKSESTHPNSDPEIRKIWRKMQIKRMDSREQGFKSTLNDYFDDQAERIIEALEAAKGVKTKTLFDDVISPELEIKIGKDLFFPVLTELLRKAGVDAMDFAGSGFKFNLSADIVSWLDDRSEVFMTQINKTTFDKLKGQFSASIEAEEGRVALINRIKRTYGDIKSNRAAVIARTEVHNATQFGTIQGYKQAGLTTKIWVSVLDGSTRDSHSSVDGEERPLDTPFGNGLMFPGDPKGSAGEIINCRCVI